MAALLLLAGCSDPELPGGDLPDESSDGITLEFTMLTRNAESVGTSRSHSRATELGFGAENYLDLQNLTFLLFDESHKMLRTFKPEISVIEDEAAPYIKYRIRTFIHDKYFLKATSENITFTIVVLGNYAQHSPEQCSYYIGEDLETIFNQASVGTFATPAPNNGSGTWIPTIAPIDGQQAGHIPMAGMQTFTVPTAALRTSTPDNPYQLSEGSSPKYVNMLRAMAKIEVIDNIGFMQGDQDHFEIEKVELMGHNSRGSILPAFSQWQNGLETSYVTAPSIPTAAEYLSAVPSTGLDISPSDAGAVVNFFYDSDASDARLDRCNVFSCYLTEYNPELVGRSNRMWIRLTMKSKESGKVARFRLEVAPYTDGLLGEPIAILRNNIYRYIITGANDINLDIQPFANHTLSFGFGLMRDSRGDLMVLPDEDGNYPEYFTEFAKTHPMPEEVDTDGNSTGNPLRLEDGDYYAIVVGESNDMTQATIWVKDRDECHVLSNFGTVHNSQDCSARWVERFFGNNESEYFLKDIFGFRRVYHFDNHNSIVRHPQHDNLLFCYIENFQQAGQIIRYYEVESWDESTNIGWIILKDSDDNEVGFQKITPDGTFGEIVPLNN